MQELDDIELLRQYAEQDSEEAFTTLVTRHVNLVYSTALRHVGNSHPAEEITQAVFVILARKARSLRRGTVLSGWLYHAARLTAANFLRSEIQRTRREQEAHMQSTLNEAETDVWKQISPLLDTAMAGLNEKDRNAIVLRFFEGRNMREVGNALGASEDAAKKRVSRAVEKLRHFFTRRGITLSAAVIAGAVSANSIQAAPVGLAVIISATAVKGSAVTASTLTLIKGALKIMAWTKMKTAIVAGVVVLLAAGTTTITVKEIQKQRTDLWALPKFNPESVVAPTILAKTPPQVRIVPSKYDHWVVGPFIQGDSSKFVDGKWIPISTNASESIGVGVTLDAIVKTAYSSDSLRTVFAAELPKSRYDFIANLQQDALKVLQEQIQKKFGLVGKKEMRETDVLVLKLSKPENQGFKPANSLKRSMNLSDSTEQISKKGTTTWFDQSLDQSRLKDSLENVFQLPIVDETGLTNQYDFSLTWPVFHDNDNERHKQITKEALLNQLGLELVPSREPIEMLVVEKVK